MAGGRDKNSDGPKRTKVVKGVGRKSSKVILKNFIGGVAWDKEQEPKPIGEEHKKKPEVMGSIEYESFYSGFHRKENIKQFIRDVRELIKIIRQITKVKSIKDKNYILTSADLQSEKTDRLLLNIMTGIGGIKVKDFIEISGLKTEQGSVAFVLLREIKRKDFDKIKDRVVANEQKRREEFDQLFTELGALKSESLNDNVKPFEEGKEENPKDETTVDELMTKGKKTIEIQISPVVHPGKIIKQELIKEQGFRGNHVADKIEVSETYLSNILKAKKPVTLYVAQELEKQFNFKSAIELYCMQAAYDAAQKPRTKSKAGKSKKNSLTSPRP